jgi:nitrite reductase (NADH) small subunit
MPEVLIAAAVRFTTVCELDDLPVGLGRAFRIGNDSVAVFRTRTGRVFATASRCTHRGGPLADGMLAGEQVVCPLHAFRFDSDTGACDQPGVCPVATYPVEVAGGLVRVGIPAGE